MHTAQRLVPERSASEIKNLNRYKSPGTDQIPAEIIKTEGWTIHSEIHKLINSIWNKAELSDGRKDSIIVPYLRRVIKQTVVIIEAYRFR